MCCSVTVFAEGIEDNSVDIAVLNSFDTIIDLGKVNDNAKKAFEYLYNKDVISLLGPEEIGPKYEMSRVEYLDILRKYFTGLEGGSVSETPYLYDVDARSWYAPVVEWALTSNTAVGVAKGYFAPEDKITMEQMITMLYNYTMQNKVFLKTVTVVDDPVVDMNMVNDWAYKAVTWANQLRILTKDESGNFNPQRVAMREDMAVLLYNYDMLREIEK